MGALRATASGTCDVEIDVHSGRGLPAGVTHIRWKCTVRSGPVRRIKRADLDGDGHTELVVGMPAP